MQDIDPPAIVRADSSEMDQLAYEATSALEAAAQSAHTALQRYRDAGEALNKMKLKCKHGEWIKLLEKMGIDRFRAGEARRVAANWSKCADAAHLTEALKTLSNGGPETEIPDPKGSPYEVKDRCNDCRKHGWSKPNCAKCKAKNKPKPEGGGKSDAAKAAAKGRASNGQPLFDWKAFDQHFGHVARFADDFARAYPVVLTLTQFHAVKRLLDELGRGMKEIKTVVAR